jgi:hypothetical protein
MMEQTIASYLFLHKECILPGVGTLKITTAPAIADYTSQQIKAPVHTISFFADERTPSVANKLLTASQLLKINLDNEGTAVLKSVGTFTRDKEGVVHFSPVTLNEVYAPMLKVPTLVQIKKVVPEKTRSTNRWWLSAAILTIITIVLILVHNNSNNTNTSVPFGNYSTIEPAISTGQYNIVK